MGGCILIEVLGAEPDLFSKAIIMMCGRNVGAGRSLSASIEMWMVDKASRWLSQVSFANSFLSAGRKN